MEDRADIDPRRLEELHRRASLRERITGGEPAPARDEPLREVLREFITGHLSGTERRIIILEYAEGLTNAEIGATLDLDPLHVAEVRRSIRERLQARISESVSFVDIGAERSRNILPIRGRQHPPGREALTNQGRGPRRRGRR
jgi:hypothetical protein